MTVPKERFIRDWPLKARPRSWFVLWGYASICHHYPDDPEMNKVHIYARCNWNGAANLGDHEIGSFHYVFEA